MSSVECHRGSVLGLLLFLLNVNDFPDWIVNGMQMFADDTKVCCTVNSVEDGQGLQNDLDSLQNWSKQWLLHFNSSKYKVMHVGHDFLTSYHLQNGEKLEELKNRTRECIQPMT